VRRSLAFGLVAAPLVVIGLTHGAIAGDTVPAPGPDASLAEIEACAARNLPDAAGLVEFVVEAADRSGEVTTSRAEIRWRRDDEAHARIVLRVSEPAETAGTALLVIDRESGEPEFHLRLPALSRVKRVRSRRLRGPVLGTDFSYEDLDRLREPMDRADLRLLGPGEIEGRAVWRLETRPSPEDGSEYARVLTHVDQVHCLPLRIDLFATEDRLRKRLRASLDELRDVGSARLPARFEMEDLERGSRTRVRIERFETRPDLPAEQFTRQALLDAVAR